MQFQHMDLSVLEQTNLAISLKENYDKKKMESLLASFTKFIQKTAWKKSKRMKEATYFEDLVSVGYQSIFKAVAKYNHEKNDNFFKYATLWVNADMRVFQKKHMSILYMGDVKFHKIFCKIVGVWDLPPDEQAKKLGVSVADINKYKDAILPAKSLVKTNVDSGEDGDEMFENNSPSPENVIAFKEVFALCNAFAKNLTEREKFIWKDWLTFEPNHAETGKILNLTRERVRQISVQLEEAFKKHLLKNGINGDSVGMVYH